MLLLALVLADSSTVKEVMVEGVASYEKGRKDIARDRAIEDALRKAVEQGVGVFLSSETVVENYEVLKDRIYTKSKGYVLSYRILREKAEDGLYRVLLSAKVKLGDIKRDLEALGLLVEQVGRPRVVVFMEDEDMRAMVEEELLKMKFPVVDYTTLSKNISKDSLRLAISGNKKLARLIALRNGAEVYIVGSSQVEEESYEGKRVYEVRLRLRAIETATGEVLASTFVRRKLPFDELETKKRAVSEAVEKLTDALIDRWREGLVVVHLKVLGVPPSKVQSLKESLYRGIRGLKALRERGVEGNYLILEIMVKGSPESVLSDLRRVKELRIIRHEGRSVEAKYVR
ncbi:MAG: hypothetical protein GXO39_07990 [Thermotogae bacterium]|nr:hypothetical protein [Thermotogota bacterium]